jgi:hypothetical protein
MSPAGSDCSTSTLLDSTQLDSQMGENQLTGDTQSPAPPTNAPHAPHTPSPVATGAVAGGAPSRPRRSLRLNIPDPPSPALDSGAGNIMERPYNPLQTHHSHVVNPPRQPDMRASSEHPISALLRRGQAKGHSRVAVMKSLLPGAGLGLFASKNIPAGIRFCDYRGSRVTQDTTDSTAYATVVPNSDLLLVGDRSICYGPFANDSRDDQMVNSKLEWEDGRCFLVSTEMILHGSEALLDYGLDYWATRLHLLDPEQRSEPTRSSDSHNGRGGLRPRPRARRQPPPNPQRRLTSSRTPRTPSTVTRSSLATSRPMASTTMTPRKAGQTTSGSQPRGWTKS